ncbi:hypothetical protein LWI29_016252 [Acer saccharum]|uniref:NB-ARC domain-containing protein n=1 Tax=Acer saccharum TaxID=4024 RepID=A0AA39SWW3_ACESA|nr:hypothetical protein LWI29_016252 [Acer saccharum]
MLTLEETKKNITDRLKYAKKSTIVLVGDSGMGKTWIARKISEMDEYYDTLWVYMTKEYKINLFYEDIAKQYLSLSPITEEWKHDEDEKPLFVIEVEPKEEKAEQEGSLSIEEKIKNKMREIGHALSIENKHLLLVLDDVGNNNDGLYVTLSTEWRSKFLPKFHNHLRIIITTRELSDRNGQHTIEVIDFPKHLQPQESLELLKRSVDKKVDEKSNFQQLCEAIKDGKSEGIRKPATITVIAKALNYIAQHDASELERAILQAANYEKTSEGEKLNPLIYCACDLIKSRVTKNCFWHSMHLFRSYGGVHFNVLITHWIMEGYFDDFDHVEEKYQEAHNVLMELIDRALLKIQENNVVAVEGDVLKMIDYCLLGFNHTAALRLFSVFKDNSSLGRVTRMDGMIKTLCNPKCWEENYTLLIDDTHLGQGDNQTSLINSMKELKVLAVFKAKCKSPLTSSLSKMEKLLVLVLRSCDLRDDDITHINKLKELKVLEISSSDSLLKPFPDKLFSRMTNLQSLNLSGLKMKSLSSLSNLRELRSLILRRSSELEEVESLKELVQLEILDLSGASSLKSMPINLFDEITNLQNLDLSGLQLIESFPSFSKLSKLRVLMLKSSSRLQKLQSLRGLGELQILDISGSTSFESFEDKTLSVLPKIQMINLSGTKIQSLPEFSELRYLTQIFLSGCRNLHYLPTLQYLSSLQILDLSGATMLKTFTDQSIQDLDQLRVLDVSNTSISKLPSIPSNLLELNLRGCSELKELQSNIYTQNLRRVTGEHKYLRPGLNYIYA